MISFGSDLSGIAKWEATPCDPEDLALQFATEDEFRRRLLPVGGVALIWLTLI
jgi:hypothetical protein